MIEYWAVIGLACLDDEFREALEDHKDTLVSLQEVTKANGFRLSLYELGEVQRLMFIEKVVECMEDIYEYEWSEDKACWTSITLSDEYAHPISIPTRDGEVVKLVKGAAQMKEAAAELTAANTAARAAKAAKKPDETLS